MKEPSQLSHIIDATRYPIADLASAACSTLLATCREQLATTGLCLLPGFIQESALAEVQREAQSLLTRSHHTEHWRATPNGADAESSSTLEEKTRASMSCIGFDQLGDHAPLRQLYLCNELTAFINALTDGPKLYVTSDPVVSCMLTVLRENDELGWHYDPNNLVVSLGIQQPEFGGEFEFAPDVRSPTANASENEKAILASRFPGVIKKSLQPGTLSLFNGHRSLHRVTPVKGNQPRIIGLFNYSEVPYFKFDSEIQQRFFGRVA